MEVVMCKNLNSKVLAPCLNISYATTLLFLITSSISANIAVAAQDKAGLLGNDQPAGFLWYKDEVPIQQKKPQQKVNNTSQVNIIPSFPSKICCLAIKYYIPGNTYKRIIFDVIEVLRKCVKR